MHNPRIKLNRSGNYEIRYTERTGERSVIRTVSTGVNDRRAAEAFLAEFLAKTDAVKVVDGSPLITDLLDSYEAFLQRNNKGETAFICVRHLRSFFDNERICQIDDDLVGEYCDARGVSDPTLRRELGALKAAINLGYKNRKLTLADVPHIELPPSGAPRTAFLSEEEEAVFYGLALAYVSESESKRTRHRLSRLARFVAVALDTGARKEAIHELTWDRIDLQAGTIDFRVPGETYRNKKRGIMPINKRLMPVLQRACEEKQNYWFLDHRGEIRSQYRTFLASTPYKHITPHCLRRTFATLNLRAGVPLETVAELLCDSIEITRRHYAHYDLKGKRQALEVRWA